MKIGDYVTRKKYNNDVIFKIVKIDNNIVYLSGVDIRLCADSIIDDLTLTTISKKKINENIIRLDKNKYFYIPGIVLHLDADKDYLEKCIQYYKNQNIKVYGYYFSEREYKENICDLIYKHNPDIVVITGHDSYSKSKNEYKNSKYFSDAIKEIYKNIKKELIIIAGACQSDYESLIKCGSTYASSPKKINIHALDPAIIASNIALTEKYKEVDLERVLSKTKYGSAGIGGIKTFGCMKVGYPRKGEN